MPLVRHTPLWLFATLGMLTFHPGVATGEARVAETDVVTCVRFWGEARYRNYGYDHIVHVANDCDEDVRCDVSTNVDPTPIPIRVRSKEQAEVRTRRGSPAREFEARATCAYIE